MVFIDWWLKFFVWDWCMISAQLKAVPWSSQTGLWPSMHWCVLSCSPHFVTPWSVALKAPLAMRLSRLEYWSGLPFPTPLVGSGEWSNYFPSHCQTRRGSQASVGRPDWWPGMGTVGICVAGTCAQHHLLQMLFQLCPALCLEGGGRREGGSLFVLPGALAAGLVQDCAFPHSGPHGALETLSYYRSLRFQGLIHAKASCWVHFFS